MPHIPNPFHRFIRDRRAASAVEFALVTPILVLLLLGSFDIARAIEVKMKVTILARTITDFISQGKTVNPTELANIFAASKTILYPYPDSSDVLTINVEAIQKQGGTYKIYWSYPPKSTTIRNSSFIPPDEAVVKTDVSYTHSFSFAGFLKGLGWDSVTLRSSSFMSPRWGDPVAADNF